MSHRCQADIKPMSAVKRRGEHAFGRWTGIVLTSNNEDGGFEIRRPAPAFSAFLRMAAVGKPFEGLNR
jgi:hypothetical protein